MSEPYHKSESCFRAYETELGLIVADWPMVRVIDPKQYKKSANTIAARLRDARNGLSKNYTKWRTDKINVRKFLDICDQIMVSILPTGMVVVGPKSAIKSASATPPVSVAAGHVKISNEPMGESPIYEVSLEGAKALCLAIGEFARPVRIKGIVEEDVKTLERCYDVEIEKLQDGVYSLV